MIETVKDRMAKVMQWLSRHPTAVLAIACVVLFLLFAKQRDRALIAERKAAVAEEAAKLQIAERDELILGLAALTSYVGYFDAGVNVLTGSRPLAGKHDKSRIAEVDTRVSIPERSGIAVQEHARPGAGVRVYSVYHLLMKKDDELWDVVTDRDNHTAGVKRWSMLLAYVPEAIERAKGMAEDKEWVDYVLALYPGRSKTSGDN